jgi:hypothetical protein
MNGTELQIVSLVSPIYHFRGAAIDRQGMCYVFSYKKPIEFAMMCLTIRTWNKLPGLGGLM